MRDIARGDETRLRDLSLRHGAGVLRLAQRLLGSAADADEILQETLFRAWRHAGRFDPARAGLGTWLIAIAWRLCADRLRARGGRTLLELEAAEDIPAPGPDPQAVLERRAALAAVQRALDALPARQRTAFLLFYTEEMSGEDAALVLGVSRRAYWSLLQRAREKVETALTGATQKAR